MMEKITFESQDGCQEFYILEQTQFHENTYLLVSDNDPDNIEANAYILKEIMTEDNEVLYDTVEDERELAALSDLFNELLSDSDISLE